MDDPRPTCTKCRQVHKRCAAHRHLDGAPCGRAASRGGVRCRVHGGATRNTLVANARRTLEADVRTLLPPREKWPKVESSLDELFDLARESRAFREALAERVAQLDDAGIRDDFGRETVRATVQVYVQAIEQSARINASIARLQVDERRLALDEKRDQFDEACPAARPGRASVCR
jgi:hypothetical protein